MNGLAHLFVTPEDVLAVVALAMVAGLGGKPVRPGRGVRVAGGLAGGRSGGPDDHLVRRRPCSPPASHAAPATP